MAYRVTANRLFHLEDGIEVRYLRGDMIDGLTDDEVKRFRAAGAIAGSASLVGKEAKATPEVDPLTVVDPGPLTHHGDTDPSFIVATNNGPLPVAGADLDDDDDYSAGDQLDDMIANAADEEGLAGDDDEDRGDEVVTTVNPDDDAQVGVDKLPPDSATKARWSVAAKARGWSDEQIESTSRETMRDLVKSNRLPE